MAWPEAVNIAEPPMYSERLPMLPMPWALSESPCTTSIRAGSSCSVSATICTKLVSMPWPIACNAVNTRTVPLPSTCSRTDS